MTPRSNWIVHFYKANVDSGSAPYADVLLTTIAGYSGYATTTVYITKSQNTKEYEQSSLTDLSGWVTSNGVLRDKFDLDLWPFDFTDSTDPDLTDWDTLSEWLSGAPHLWMRIVAGTRNYPTDVTKAVPVYIESINQTPNPSAGVHNVILSMRKKSRY